MPMIHTAVNRKITPEQEEALAQQLGKAIALLGKSERWLMLQFDDERRLYFRGAGDQPLAFVSVKLLGSADKQSYERMTAEITRIIGDTLSIAPDCIYVQYEETEHWGWNGSNF